MHELSSAQGTYWHEQSVIQKCSEYDVTLSSDKGSSNSLSWSFVLKIINAIFLFQLLSGYSFLLLCL